MDDRIRREIMGILGNLRDKLAAFMYGRYGADQLYKALIVLYFILFAANLFANSIILTVVMWAVLFWTIFRSFSKNISQRSMENDKFMNIWNTIKAKAMLSIRRIKEIRTRRYRKCPHCKSVLRLPRKTGKRTVTCPRCNKRFQTNIIF